MPTLSDLILAVFADLAPNGKTFQNVINNGPDNLQNGSKAKIRKIKFCEKSKTSAPQRLVPAKNSSLKLRYSGRYSHYDYSTMARNWLNLLRGLGKAAKSEVVRFGVA